MSDTENKWKLIKRYENLDISKNFEVQISLVLPPDGPPHISLRKFAKYLTSEEKKRGLTDDTAFFRPMKEGVIIPACKFNDLLTQIQHVITGSDQLSCYKIRLFSKERLSELRLNVTNDSNQSFTPMLTIEKWAQLRNSDRTKTGIQTLYPTTKISIPIRCIKNYLLAEVHPFADSISH